MAEQYYNSIKPDVDHIHPVGTEVSFSSKTGGGAYVVIGHINCSRCNTVLEDREIVEYNRSQKKNGTKCSSYHWCHNCGLYEAH